MGVRVAVIAGVVVGAITVTHHHTATHLTLTQTAFRLQISIQVSHFAWHAEIVHGRLHHTASHHIASTLQQQQVLSSMVWQLLTATLPTLVVSSSS